MSGRARGGGGERRGIFQDIQEKGKGGAQRTRRRRGGGNFHILCPRLREWREGGEGGSAARRFWSSSYSRGFSLSFSDCAKKIMGVGERGIDTQRRIWTL